MVPLSPSPARRGFMLLELAVCIAVLALLLALLLPAVTRSREAARRTQCKNNLKQIGLALHNYHDTLMTFPPAYTADDKRLHSWRTLIIPYIDASPLYNMINLSKPWDDPANSEVFPKLLPVYACPSSLMPPGQTTYLAIITADSVIRPGASRSIREIKDGASNTLMVIEAPYDRGVLWMSPQDANDTLAAAFTSDGAKNPHVGGCHALIADGSVRFLSQNIAPETFTALTTAAGGDKVGEF